MKHYLDAAMQAARKAGDLLRTHFHQPRHVNSKEKHDIKLEIDVQSQELITQALLKNFPNHALYGEEGIVGDQESEFQWVVDPLDGTVNYFYGIPHFCVSIALRFKSEIIVGVIYDPMRDEIWTVQKGGEPTLNGSDCRVSERTELRRSDRDGRTFQNGRDDRIGHATAATDGAKRAQMPADGKRRVGNGLCRVRPHRRLHRTRNQFVGHRRGLDSGRDCRRHSRNATAQGYERQIQHRRLERRDRFEVVMRTIRCGIGYDVHRLAQDRKLILGGVEIAHRRGLDGHPMPMFSAHAIADALLGAIGERISVTIFRTRDESIRGISSIEILKRVNISRQTKARAANVDATLIAEAPGLVRTFEAMKKKIGDAMWTRIGADQHQSDIERRARCNRSRRRHGGDGDRNGGR